MDEPENKSPAHPSLGIALQAETAALRNDLDQATELAAEYQKRLSNKNNDFAALKMTLEKALKDLDAMQLTIGELRAERHRFANEAMRAIALERRLQKVATERDHMRLDLELHQARCTCQGSEARCFGEDSTQSATPPLAQAAKSQEESGRAERTGPGRAFIPLAFDGPEDPMDVSFSS